MKRQRTPSGTERGKELDSRQNQRKGSDPDGLCNVNPPEAVAEPCHFDRLPPEVTQMVLSQAVRKPYPLDPSHLRKVCTIWNDLLRPTLVFKGTLNDQTIHGLVELDPQIELKYLILTRLEVHRIGGSISLPSVGNSVCYRNQNGGNIYNANKFVRSVKHLVIGGDVGKFLKICGSEEQPFSLSTGFAESHTKLDRVKNSMCGSDLVNILGKFKGIETLTLTSIAFLSISMRMLRRIDFSVFSSLTKLDICIGMKTCPEMMLYFLENVSWSNLTSFYARIYSGLYHMSIYVGLLKFIAKHPKLKNISLSQTLAIYTVPVKDVFEPNGDLIVSNYPNLTEDILKIKLDCLRWDCVLINHPIGDEWKLLELQFLQNQTQLRSLDLHVCERDLVGQLEDLVPPCEKTLEHFELSSTHINPHHFSCSRLADFEKLSRCHLYLRGSDYDFNEAISISHIHLLPVSLKSLHLAVLPSFENILTLQSRLKNLERISYGGTKAESCPTLRYFVHYLFQHLKFPSLFEFKYYRFFCSSLVSMLNAQRGLFAFIEEDNCLTVYVEKERFNSEDALANVLAILLAHGM